jgi:hypothetical protein
MAKKHWTINDFIITTTTPSYDGSNTVNRFGYCRICLADMQSFGDNGRYGPVHHYKSHETSKRLVLWGKKLTG